jgi:hypothetical protein
MPPAAVRRLFSQQKKNPKLTTLIAISDALDLRVTAAAIDGLRLDESSIRSRPHS